MAQELLSIKLASGLSVPGVRSRVGGVMSKLRKALAPKRVATAARTKPAPQQSGRELFDELRGEAELDKILGSKT